MGCVYGVWEDRDLVCEDSPTWFVVYGLCEMVYVELTDSPYGSVLNRLGVRIFIYI